MTSRNGDVAKLVKMLRTDGWTVEQSKKACHFHVRDPQADNALVCVFASSPGRGHSHTTNRVFADINRYLKRKEEEEAA